MLVCIITYDQTGTRIITASDESLIKVWSSRSGLLLMTLRGHEGEVMDMQIHPDNTLLASCDDKKVIRIWSLHSGATLTVLMGHSSKITTISWCPAIAGNNIRVLLSTGNDSAVIFWSYDETEKQFDSDRPIKFVERTKASDKARVYNFINLDF